MGWLSFHYIDILAIPLLVVIFIFILFAKVICANERQTSIACCYFYHVNFASKLSCVNIPFPTSLILIICAYKILRLEIYWHKRWASFDSTERVSWIIILLFLACLLHQHYHKHKYSLLQPIKQDLFKVTSTNHKIPLFSCSKTK